MCKQPSVVHRAIDKFDVYVGRPSKWGNPFMIGRDGDRDQCIALYREWIETQPALLKAIEAGELYDQTLACWCAPKACHADVLVELSNAAADRYYERQEVSELMWDAFHEGGGTFEDFATYY